MTDDPGMKDMLSYLIARDTMHQNQWLAAWVKLGGLESHPIPNNFPQKEEPEEFSYTFLTFGNTEDVPQPSGRWSRKASPRAAMQKSQDK